MKNKIEAFAKLLETQTIKRLQDEGLGCAGNIVNARTRVEEGRKYSKVNQGTSGRFMVENATGNIFGIKGYGQVHKGHFYGTVDTTDQYFWGGYHPTRIDGSLKIQPANGCPVITHAPTLETVPISELLNS